SVVDGRYRRAAIALAPQTSHTQAKNAMKGVNPCPPMVSRTRVNTAGFRVVDDLAADPPAAAQAHERRRLAARAPSQRADRPPPRGDTREPHPLAGKGRAEA